MFLRDVMIVLIKIKITYCNMHKAINTWESSRASTWTMLI